MKRSLLLFCLIIVSWSCNQQKGINVNEDTSEENSAVKYRLAAHRGGIVEGVFNEFDRKSVQAAIDSGYWMVEVDLRPTADRNIILHHDPSMKRIYDVDKRPEQMTLSELKELKAIAGGNAPMTLEEAVLLCRGKVHFMVDLKPQSSEPWFYTVIDSILKKYDMLDGAFFIRNDVESFFSGGKFGFRMAVLPEMLKRIDNGENISGKYYLFDHGNRINAEAARICQKNNIDVCASVNIGHYVLEPHEYGAMRDIEYLKKAGVTLFQIDSDYDKYFD